MAELENYQFPDIALTDYIDESLIKILNRDNASRISFRCTGNFPSPVTEELIGMTCYRVDLKAEYRLVSVTPDPVWQLISNESGTATNREEVAANYQKKSAALSSLSSLSSSKDTLPYFSDKDTMALTGLTEFARSILSKLTKEEVRGVLGLGSAATINVPINGNYIQDGSITVDKLSPSASTSLTLPTGTCVLTLANTAPEGWIIADDGTIGSSSSGATNASDTTKDLFYLLWSLPSTSVYTATGNLRDKGSTPDIDWNANARLSLPKTYGRVLGVAGAGEGLTNRLTGSTTGNETHTLTVEEIPAHTHPSTNSSGAGYAKGGGSGSGPFVIARGSTTGGSTGGGQAHSIMQPTTFLNLMIKL